MSKYFFMRRTCWAAFYSTPIEIWTCQCAIALSCTFSFLLSFPFLFFFFFWLLLVWVVDRCWSSVLWCSVFFDCLAVDRRSVKQPKRPKKRQTTNHAEQVRWTTPIHTAIRQDNNTHDTSGRRKVQDTILCVGSTSRCALGLWCFLLPRFCPLHPQFDPSE